MTAHITDPSRLAGRLATLLVTGTLLAACAGGPPPTTYDLSAPRQPPAGRGGATLVVAEPSAIQALETDRLIVRTGGGVVTFLGGVQWVDRLPRLLQNRLIQTLENGGRLRSVGRPGDRITAQYQLTSDIRTFEVQEQSREAVVEVSVKLVTEGTGRIAAARVFSGRAPVSAIDGAGAAAALDTALGSVLRQIAAWTGQN